MAKQAQFFLMPNDPSPVEVVNEQSQGNIIFVCEHAGRGIPRCLGDLGVLPDEMERHIAYDVGADSVARKLAAAFSAPLYIQPYSRLVIDCNRPLGAVDLVPEVSDGTYIPKNIGLSAAECFDRYAAIHQPFHDAIAKALDLRDGVQHPTLITIHSFTPVMRDSGEVREVQLGLLYNRDQAFSQAMRRAVQAHFPFINVALNEPYDVTDEGDYTIPVHGERRGLPHVLIEIRSDCISDECGQTEWAEILETVIKLAAASVAKTKQHQ
ncbi:N-formylglutamate amidohydrolase [Neorhizobium galegae bv. officinalis]|uniref:N-formylglutamate amidohydrolase n=1 Tax=Neorhizobium galegae bv. officinalis TaxID=323656 RepID=A0A0T7H1R3_NEOGA|nr:N-formylglutamate amidohydrolase [Neorhizobium galegae]CDZ41420.1 N-formylglutamate amidohydrolase [Neorhizobium galegae bv. officinalis]CDZ53418.1 N-formylglutamate amidohydrolase [Neorhizobium galegae bv. officinalis]